MIFDVSAGDLTRKIVFNTAEQDSSIIGEEAFMLPVSTEETTLGYFVSRDFGNYSYDLGIRSDEISRSGSVAHHDDDHAEDEEGEIENYDKDLSALSVAFNFDQGFYRKLKRKLRIIKF